MEVMYLKYKNGIRQSIIKEGGIILMNDSKIIPFKIKKETPTNKSTQSLNTKDDMIISKWDDKVNEEITNFFFDAIHKNYIKAQSKK
jgi:hypothetical protein